MVRDSQGGSVEVRILEGFQCFAAAAYHQLGLAGEGSGVCGGMRAIWGLQGKRVPVLLL